MQYVNLGKTGLKVSRLCLGMMTYGTAKWRDWVLDEEQSRPFIQRALEAGINFFDTADVYSLGVSEEVTGRALRDFAKRDEVVLATKVFNPMGDKPNQRGLSRKHVMDGIDASLRRLGVDYVDLYQIHRYDSETPIEETMEALHDVVKAGKARYIGASSMYAWQFAKAQHTAEKHGWTKFVAMQNHYNLVYREEEREMIPLCLDQGIGVIPWSPLARGFLAGNRTRDKGGETARSKSDAFAHHMYYQDNDFATLERTQELAKQRGVSSAQIALACSCTNRASARPSSARARCINWKKPSPGWTFNSLAKKSKPWKNPIARIRCWGTVKGPTPSGKAKVRSGLCQVRLPGRRPGSLQNPSPIARKRVGVRHTVFRLILHYTSFF